MLTKFLKNIGVISRQIEDMSENEKKELSDFIRFGVRCEAWLSTNNISPLAIIELFKPTLEEEIKRRKVLTDIADYIDEKDCEGEDEDKEDCQLKPKFQSAKSVFENYVKETISETHQLLEHVNLKVGDSYVKGLLVAVVELPGHYRTFVIEHYGNFYLVYVKNEGTHHFGFVGKNTVEFYETALSYYKDLITYRGTNES